LQVLVSRLLDVRDNSGDLLLIHRLQIYSIKKYLERDKMQKNSPVESAPPMSTTTSTGLIEGFSSTTGGSFLDELGHRGHAQVLKSMIGCLAAPQKHIKDTTSRTSITPSTTSEKGLTYWLDIMTVNFFSRNNFGTEMGPDEACSFTVPPEACSSAAIRN